MLLWSVAFGLIVMSAGVYLSFSNNPKIQEANSTAISLVEEATSSIRNVKAMGAEPRLAKKYSKMLREAGKWATRQNIQLGISFGKFFFDLFVFGQRFQALKGFVVVRIVTIRAIPAST